MPSCIVNHCVSKSGKKASSEDIMLHKFPSDIEKIILWLLQTGQEFSDIYAMADKIYNGRKQNRFALCSLHFEKDAYALTSSSRVLKKDALPTLFPHVPEGESVIEESLKKDRHRNRKRPLELTTTKKVEEIPKCIVNGCVHNSGWKYSTPGVTMHMFPKDLNAIKTWLHHTNQEYGDLDLFAQEILERRTGVVRLCSAHFAPECYSLVGSQKVLLDNAVPTIFLERDKTPNQMAPMITPLVPPLVTPMHPNVYLPLNMCTTALPLVSNISPLLTQLIIPSLVMTQNNNVAPTNLGVNVGTTVVDPPAIDFGKCPPPTSLPVFHNVMSETVEPEKNVSVEPRKVQHDHNYKAPGANMYPGLDQSFRKTDHVTKDGFGSYIERSHSESELFSMLHYLTSIFQKNKNKDVRTSRILNQALRIISLIAGEEWIIVKKNSTHTGVQQLNGEFSVKCGDMAIFFTMDEWSYIDKHKEDYKDLFIDNIPMDHTRDPPEHWDSDHIMEQMFKVVKVEEIEPVPEENGGVEMKEEKMEEEFDEEDEDDFEEEDLQQLKEPQSSDWEPESERESEEGKESSAEEPPITYDCDCCAETFLDAEALEAHKATHEETCPDCDEVLRNKSELIKHRAENHATKRFACTICGIEYNYKSQFVIHQRAHTKEKPFHCNHCGKKFGHRCSLLVHQRRHTDGKTYKCSECERTFDKSCELTKHEKVHDPRRQYQCKTCQMTFIHRRALKKHKLRNSDCESEGETKVQKKTYKCKRCKKTFILRRNYKKHFDRCTPEVDDE
ncbi:hypothetical protein GDO81_019408 [Engystomops pustulosus]|uniref:Uncharacterized protein n=1 Tax=Engystomops pustulosus TaxID=76066 RepID=A0AAV6ZFX4_ENGPU|nr:hypothetical protein GDO81_019408 [Engystomops pustulosus]KAG8546241.1 hypothetical protein GDO81_019408 [Engystomops pustulosus]KAG8546242.1 hypothetical protein GDO81_019408 [Engystomops pustulosus]KAG8546243.1 hypothetical protein GDO81_019408 [Engystomops pustulosus]